MILLLLLMMMHDDDGNDCDNYEDYDNDNDTPSTGFDFKTDFSIKIQYW
jgi:hypothetical protein